MSRHSYGQEAWCQDRSRVQRSGRRLYACQTGMNKVVESLLLVQCAESTEVGRRSLLYRPCPISGKLRTHGTSCVSMQC